MGALDNTMPYFTFGLSLRVRAKEGGTILAYGLHALLHMYANRYSHSLFPKCFDYLGIWCAMPFYICM